MKVGYIRVSTVEQNTARQDVLMHELEVEKIFTDKQSGKDTERSGLKDMLDFVRSGDIVIVESYSRLARSSRDLLNIIDTLQDKEVEFKSIKENIDTTTASGKLMLTVFAGLYEFERTCTLERTREGIDLAKKAGKYKGRQPIKMDQQKFTKLYDEWKRGERTAVSAYKALNLSRSTFYRKVREYEKGMLISMKLQ